MKKFTLLTFITLIISLLVACNNKDNATHLTESFVIDFNFDWRFQQSDNDKAYQLDFDDSEWQAIQLPHDWSIKQGYTLENTSGSTAYLPAGKGWYRKRFPSPKKHKKVQVLFDGVYNHSKVYINGKLLGYRPYGYVPFHYDLTDHLYTDGRENVMAVFVDHSRYIDSRWYTGSGIYRNVQLLVSDKTHFPIWSTFITTPKVNESSATVKLTAELKNDLDKLSHGQLHISIIAPDGSIIQKTQQSTQIPANQSQKFHKNFEITTPKLWNLDSPHLYTAQLAYKKGDRVVSLDEQKFGIRSLRNDPDKGFFLNGRTVKIKGVNIHHDGGLVGAAVPKDVWLRRLQQLKEAGVNTIRTAHNPASKEFMQLCDELGFLVQAEAFDEWDNPKDKRKNFNQQGDVDHLSQSYNQFFKEWGELDIKAMVLRDRNSPSVFQWSIGNEIEWTYPRYTNATGYWGKAKQGEVSYYWDQPPLSISQMQQVFNDSPVKGAQLAKTAANLAKWVKEIDTTRPVTANLVTPSVSHFAGYADVLDIIGYSYRQSVYDWGRKHYPNKMILGTENWVKWHEWKAVKDRDDIPGIMVWTGIDYLGEKHGSWPKKGSSSGMLDFAGFKKPAYHMMKTLWNDEPHLYMTTYPIADSKYKLHNAEVVEKEPDSWAKEKWGWRSMNTHWNYQQDQNIVIEVYTNQPAVELFLDDKSLGIKYLEQQADHILKWAVPYQKGVLTAKAANGASTSLTSAEQPHQVLFSADTTKLMANGYDVAHLVAQVVDKHGIPVKHIEKELTFSLPDNIRLLGVDNGAADNVQKHFHNQIVTSQGRALLIVQSKTQSGIATITANSKGLVPSSIKITMQ